MSLGRNCGGLEKTSLRGLSDVVTSQKTGPRTNTARAAAAR
jgi:hypothetical protein